MDYNYKKMDEQKDKSKKKKWSLGIFLGIVGAIFWSGIAYLIFWLNFMSFSPSHFSKPFIKSEYLFRWEGILSSLLIVVLLSILISLIYSYLFAHLNSPWIGIILGGILWYLLLGWRKLDVNSFFSTFSIFILYGVFIGYSLSAEFSDPEKK